MDEEFMNTLRNLGTKWYHCPNGHAYTIGECGLAMVESRCPECGEKIGGRDHKLLKTNKLVDFDLDVKNNINITPVKVLDKKDNEKKEEKTIKEDKNTDNKNDNKDENKTDNKNDNKSDNKDENKDDNKNDNKTDNKNDVKINNINDKKEDENINNEEKDIKNENYIKKDE